MIFIDRKKLIDLITEKEEKMPEVKYKAFNSYIA